MRWKGIWFAGMVLLASVNLEEMSPQQRRLEGLRLYIGNMLDVYRFTHRQYPASCSEFMNSPVMFRQNFYLDEPAKGAELRCVEENPQVGEFSIARDKDASLTLLFPNVTFRPSERFTLKEVLSPVTSEEHRMDLFVEALARHLDAAVNEFEMVTGCYPNSLEEMERVLGNLFKPDSVDLITGEPLRSLFFFSKNEWEEVYNARWQVNQKLLGISSLPEEQRNEEAKKYSYPKGKRIYVDILNGIISYFVPRPQFLYVSQIEKTFPVNSIPGNLGIARVLRKFSRVSLCKNL